MELMLNLYKYAQFLFHFTLLLLLTNTHIDSIVLQNVYINMDHA